MSRESGLAVAVVVLVCCCFCANRDEDPGSRQQPREGLAAVAYAPATEAARATANAYVSELEAALERELPSLVLLDTAIKDWCDERECVLDVDYFFGLDADLRGSMSRIDAVLRRDSAGVLMGMDGITSGRTPCPELRYELRRPQGITDIGTRRWIARAVWAETGGTAPGCGGQLLPAPEVVSGSAYPVRDKDVDVAALLAGVRGKHRSIVQIGVGGSYHTGGAR